MQHGAATAGRRWSESSAGAGATYLGRQHVVLEPEQQRPELGHSRHYRPQVVRAPESDVLDHSVQHRHIPPLSPQVRNGQLSLELVELSLLQIRCNNGRRRKGRPNKGHGRVHDKDGDGSPLTESSGDGWRALYRGGIGTHGGPG